MRRRRTARRGRPAVNLRSYQAAAVEAASRGLAEHESVLLSMATGTGKTWVFSALAHKAAAAGWRVLILAHREELLEQARKTLLTINPATPIGYVKATDRRWEQITVASVMSLQKSRLAEMPPAELVITDEAHHADAPSYTAIYNRQRRLSSHFRHVGVTATPYRSHKRERGQASGLDAFDARVFEYGLERAVRDGWLSEIRALAPIQGFNLVGLQRDKITGDFSGKAVEARLNRPDVHDRVIRIWRRECNAPAIAFCATIKHAQGLAEAFRRKRIPAAAVWSGMEKPSALGKGSRTRVIDSFKAGGIKIITNVGMLTEGFDAPQTRAVIMLRPTGSLNVYSQMIGRVTRKAPGKKEGLVLDFTGNASSLDLSAARISDLAEIQRPEDRVPNRYGSEVYEVYRITRARGNR